MNSKLALFFLAVAAVAEARSVPGQQAFFGSSSAISSVLTESSSSCASVSDSTRADCGYIGVTQSTCEAVGCCWAPAAEGVNLPWCFYPPNTDLLGGEIRGTTCPSNNAAKRDCGYLGSTQSSCEADGCCWSPSSISDVPWCFYKTGDGSDIYVPSPRDDWRKRSIYFMLTDRFSRGSNPNGDGACYDWNNYCGGTFKGIEQNLDYITGMGFDAIWITPIVANVAGGYHGYHASNIFRINPRLGSSQDLLDLVNAAHRKNVWVMLDVVPNHMGDNPFDRLVPFNSSQYFHPKCEINSSDQISIEKCWLAGLPDLDTENNYVVNTLNKWVRDVVRIYKFDGIRLDTGRHIRKDFWPGFVNAAGVFATGEMSSGDPYYIGDYTKTGGMDSAINFPMYYTLRDVFARQHSMQEIENRRSQNSAYRDPRTLLNFVDNHDESRFLSLTNDYTLLKNALTYILMSDGIPCIYYGTEQAFSGEDTQANREPLWPHFRKDSLFYVFFSQINGLRHRLGDAFYNSPHVQIYTEYNYHVFTRGPVIIIVNNLGSGRYYDKTIPVSLNPGVYTDLFTGRTFTVNTASFRFTIENGQPLILTKN